jgi:ubiquinone/menaquinone biosynthesis C-methylase UbiE
MDSPGQAQAAAAATYNAAADTYDDAANSFWDRFGRRTVDRLALAPGARVLDVCCGSGASAIPAARAVGPTGSVLGIDLAQRMLEIARRKAAQQGLRHVEFRTGDLLALGLPEATFDAAICVFGIFFVPDMAAAVRALWRVVRPGGRLAVTTWGPDFFEPASTAFWDAVRDVAPALHKGFNPWDRITDPASLRELFAEAGIASCEAVAEAGEHPIPSPDAWWTAVLGSGYRGTVDKLDAASAAQVRAANLRFIRERGVKAVQANVVHAIATKPS